jgi:hypothetical protein
LLGFGSAHHAICLECIAKKTRARVFDFHNALNANAAEKEDPAVQFKLNRRTWNGTRRFDF